MCITYCVMHDSKISVFTGRYYRINTVFFKTKRNVLKNTIRYRHHYNLLVDALLT